MTLTLQEAKEKSGRWNAYVGKNIRYHCPVAKTVFKGNGNTCPHCFTPLHELSHWKWYSPDEPHPREVLD